jgi:hypothetical protein
MRPLWTKDQRVVTGGRSASFSVASVCEDGIERSDVDESGKPTAEGDLSFSVASRRVLT